MLGTSASYYGETWNQTDAAGFGNDLFSYKKLEGAAKKDMFELGSDFSSYTLMSYTARLNYVFDSRYYVTGTIRRDGSSRFSRGNQWGIFPSLVGSWNVTGESFMQNQNIFDNLRVRLGYGLSGNQNIPNYGFLTLFNPRTSLGNYILENSGLYGNPELKWEAQKQWNTGLDISVLKNRLNFVLDFFHISNDDLLMQKSMAGSSGYSTQLANVGLMENKGVELSIDADLIDARDFKWDLGFTLSANKNKITKLYDNMDVLYKLGGYSNNEIQREGNLFVGESINNIYVYKFDKIAQDEDMNYVNSLDLGSRIVKPGDILPLDRDGNGIINDNDRYIVGNTDPDFYGGIHTSFSYKDISLNVIGTYSVGADRISYLYENLMSGKGASAAHEDMKNRWTPENTNTNIPRAYSEGGRFGLNEVDWAVQDASFFRLSVVTLSYKLPAKWLDAVKIDNLRLYVTANNLATFSKYKGFDPEGGDWYPTSKMYVVGLNLTF
jgi:TonB-linked SusC/RagA family outer membrane protein